MKMQDLKLYLEDEMLIEEVASRYIKDMKNAKRFVQSYMVGFEKENKDWVFDYVEVLDSDNVEISTIELIDSEYKIKFDFRYILTVWYKKKQKARITALANGICMCSCKNNVCEGDLKIIKLSNVLDEYDDNTIFD